MELFLTQKIGDMLSETSVLPIEMSCPKTFYEEKSLSRNPTIQPGSHVDRDLATSN